MTTTAISRDPREIVGGRWVSESETPTESEFSLLLSPDLFELSSKLEAARKIIRRAGQRDEVWRAEVARMIELLAAEAAEALGTTGTYPTGPSAWTVSAVTPRTTEVPWSSAPPLITVVTLPGGGTYVGSYPSTYRVGTVITDYDKLISGGSILAGDLWPKPMVASSAAPAEGPTAKNPALEAFERVKARLSLSDEETAVAAGIGKKTVYSWLRGTNPRPSTVRQLFELDSLTTAMLRARNASHLQDLLHGEEVDGRTIDDHLRQGNIEPFTRRVRATVFGEAPLPPIPSLEPDADVELTAKLPPLRRRRSRRRRS